MQCSEDHMYGFEGDADCRDGHRSRSKGERELFDTVQGRVPGRQMDCQQNNLRKAYPRLGIL